MSVDLFSDILKLARTNALVTGGFTAGGAWALRFPVPKVVKFFAVVKGQCHVLIDGEPEPLLFQAGDVGLLSARRAFTLASDPGVTPVDAMTLFTERCGRKEAVLGDGEDFAYLGGHVLFDPLCGQLLLDILPPWFHVKASSAQADTLRWLLAQLVEEQSHHEPGAELAAAQLAQLLFIQILRSYVKSGVATEAGWLKVLQAPRIAPALAMLHGDPARNWRLEELARGCAMSRTTFALRFREAAGIAPMAYLQAWRMHLARGALRTERTAVAAVAESLGFSSTSAFSNAFRRITGYSPTQYQNLT